LRHAGILALWLASKQGSRQRYLLNNLPRPSLRAAALPLNSSSWLLSTRPLKKYDLQYGGWNVRRVENPLLRLTPKVPLELPFLTWVIVGVDVVDL
jgi:hypothetical protein